MKIDFKTAVLPHLIAILIFLGVTVTFFMPLFEGKELRQSDLINYKGASKEIVDFREKTGEEPLWTNSMFGGMPAYQISITAPHNLIRSVTIFFADVLTSPGAIIFLCMLGFYILLQVLKAPPYLSIIGAIAFGFSSYFLIIIEAGHVTKGYAIAYMAPVIAGVILTFRGDYLKGAALTALALALEISANHLQITYYLVITLFFIGLIYFAIAYREGRVNSYIKAIVLLFGVAILAAAPSATNLLTTYEYGKDSTRGSSELTSNAGNKTSGLDKDYATQWSYGVGETFTLMVPNYKGGGSSAIGNSNKDALQKIDSRYKQYIANMDSYWGDQPFTSGPVYAGAIVIFLFVLGLLIVEGPVKWGLLAATLLAIMLAWGKNFMPLTNFFLDHVPGYNKFRAVSMILVIAEFTIPLLAFIALTKIVQNPDMLRVNKRPLYIALGITAGLCLLMLIAPGLFQSFYKHGEYDDLVMQLQKSNFPDDQVTAFTEDLRQVRMSIFKADVLRSLLFIIASALLVYLYSLKKIGKAILYCGIGILVLFDMWSVNKRYLNKDNFVPKISMEKPFAPSAADKAILADTAADYRVLNIAANTFNDASTSYFHKSIGGYHGAKLKRYQEIIDHYLSGSISAITQTLQTTPTDSAVKSTLAEQQVLNMLNTKYIIYNPEAPPLPNPYAFGNAWFVNSVKMVANADEEIASIGSEDLKEVAVVDKRYANEVGEHAPAANGQQQAMLTSYAPNKLSYKINSTGGGIVVFSEIYYDKGWNAYIDGKLQPHFRADYILRGMKVPAGAHTVEFRFEPKVYATGENIALAGSLGIIILVIAGVVVPLRSNFKKAKE